MGTTRRYKPFFMTWTALELAMQPLHMGVKADVDTLHDLWKGGAPSPNTRVLTKTYDPRTPHAGYHEARLVWFGALSAWIRDVGTRRGLAITPEQAHGIVARTALHMSAPPTA